MKPIAVAEFTTGVVRGGAEEHILMLLRGLDRNLFRPYLVCTPQLASRISTDVPADVEIVQLGLEEPTQLSRVIRLGRILREREIQILHSHGFYSSLCASAVGWWNGVPAIVETSHGREAWRKGWKANFTIDRLVGRFVDRYIAVSKANARYLIDEKRLPARKITVIYPGSDLNKFDPGHQIPEGFQKRAGIAAGDKVLVFVGRLEHQKGHSVLLEAMPLIREAFPQVKLFCAGEGSLRQALERKVIELSLDDCVSFVGYPPDVRDWLAAADLTVLPSFYEGLPVTPIESLASGKPVVATAVDGTPEVVIDGKTGLTVPPGNPKKFAAAVCRLLRDPLLAQQLAEQGRDWVLSNFSVERLVEKTERFYTESWENRRRQTKSADRRKQNVTHRIHQRDEI